jgi:hypothetical protein
MGCLHVVPSATPLEPGTFRHNLPKGMKIAGGMPSNREYGWAIY